MPSIPQLDEALTDGRVALRDAAERDIPEILIAYQDDPQLHVSLGQRRPPSGAELGRHFEQEPAERAAGRRATLAVLEEGEDVCRGVVNVHYLDWENSRGDICMWLVPQVRGRGLAARALRLGASWLLRTCGIARVQVLTEPSNEAMVRAALSAGFVQEARLRGYLRRAYGRVDAVVLSLLAGDLQP